MSDNRRSSNDEEPQEEFINDEATDSQDEKPGSEGIPLSDWSLQDLRQKAAEEDIEGYEQMNKEELIEELKDRR